MKRIFLTIIIATIAMCSYAQPRAAGLRVGVSEFELDYQHIFKNKNQFLECDLGVDFGWLGKCTPAVKAGEKIGFKATGVYNFVWARPAWTNKGSWALYAGPGLTIGAAHDDVHYMAEDGDCRCETEETVVIEAGSFAFVGMQSHCRAQVN